MARMRWAWVLLSFGPLRLGSCTDSPSALQALQLVTNKDKSGHQNSLLRDSSCAWVKIGLFELPTVEELKEEMLGYKPSTEEDAEGEAVVTTVTSNSTKVSTSRALFFSPAARLEWVSRELGKVAEGGGATLQTWAARSLEMGRKGGLWLQKRWRMKLVCCALAIYGYRVAGRVAVRISASLRNAGTLGALPRKGAGGETKLMVRLTDVVERESWRARLQFWSSDVLLDADDRALGSRGAILDVEGLALLMKLGALGDPPPAVSAGLRSSGGETRKDDGPTAAEECHGWRALEHEVRLAIGLRYTGGRRGLYAEELAQALRELEEARDNADFEVLGSQRSSFVEQVVLLIQARLCDACLRSLRDGLVRSASDLSTLCAFWKDQKSSHRRMGVIKSVMLGRLHGKVFGKRAAVEKDQEKISTCELLLEGRLRRLGVVQSHLQARPRVSVEAMTPTFGGTFTEASVKSLEAWMDNGIAIFLRELEELESTLTTSDASTSPPQRQLGAIDDDDVNETSTLLPEYPWHAPNAAAVAAATSGGAAEDAQGHSAGLRESRLKGAACPSLLPVGRLFEDAALDVGVRDDSIRCSAASDRVAVTVLRAGGDVGGGGDSNGNIINTIDVGSGSLSPYSDGEIPGWILQGVPPGPAVGVTIPSGAMRRQTALQGTNPGNVIPAVILLRWKFKSKSARPEETPDQAPSSGVKAKGVAQRGVEVEKKTFTGKDGRDEIRSEQRGAAATSDRTVGGGKGMGVFVSKVWAWLIADDSSEQQRPQSPVAAGTPASETERRAMGSSLKEASGGNSAVSCERRPAKGDTNAGEVRAGGGGWKEWLTSDDSGGRRQQGGGSETRSIVEKKRTVKRSIDPSEVSSKRMQSKASDVEAKFMGFRKARRFHVSKTFGQEGVISGGSERFVSVTGKGKGLSAASKEGKERESALADADAKLVAEDEQRNLLGGLFGRRRWKSWASSATVATFYKFGRRDHIPRFRGSRKNSINEKEGANRNAVGDGTSSGSRAPAPVAVAVMVVAMAAAVVMRITAGGKSPLAVGCLAVESSARFVGKTAAHGFLKTVRFCAGSPAHASSFYKTKAVPAVKHSVKMITTRWRLGSKASRGSKLPQVESMLPSGGSEKNFPGVPVAAGSAFSGGDAEPNVKDYEEEDLALAGVVVDDFAHAGTSFAVSGQVSKVGHERTFSMEHGVAPLSSFDEKTEIEPPPGSLPPLPAVHSLSHDSPLGSFTFPASEPNDVLAPESQETTSFRNELLMPSRVPDIEEASTRFSSDAPPFDNLECTARRSRCLVDGAIRAARTVAPSGGSGIAGPGGVRTIGVARTLRARAAREAAIAGCARPGTNKAVRVGIVSALAAPAAVRLGRYVRHNLKEFRRIQLEAVAGLSTFFSEQLWEPCQAIAKQVLFRERQSYLVDEAAFRDAEMSLRNMLRDFVNERKNKVPEELRESVVAAMDMSVVSRALEKETRGAIRGTVSGRIPRMLLIQTTFLKKELLQAMGGIDDLYQANQMTKPRASPPSYYCINPSVNRSPSQVTLRLISTLPAALVIIGVFKVTTVLLLAAFSRRLEPTTLVHRSMRTLVREIERLLTSSSGFEGGEGARRADGWTAGAGLLDDEETGKLALFLHTLQNTLRQNSSRFEARVRRGLEDDLSDMTKGRASVSRQMEIVRRMQRSYPFLRPEGGKR